MSKKLNNLTKGTWIFTCSMKPLQFLKWNDIVSDVFETVEGSQHSRKIVVYP